jgi:uncharacterized protein YkwD
LIRYFASTFVTASLLCLPFPQAVRAAESPSGLASRINAMRALGCGGTPGIPVALKTEPRLDRVAEALATGHRLVDAMKDAGYITLQSAVLTASCSDADITCSLAGGACRHIADPVYHEVGIATRGRSVWIVLAAPLVPLAPGEAAEVGHRVLQLVNEARASLRRCGRKRFDAVSPLVLSDALNRVALEHARDMASRGSLDHAGSDGSTHAERATRAGYPWRAVGENIAAGQPNAEQVVAGWLKSAGHCANLMDPDFSEMGVAFAIAPQGGKGIYWAQMFGTPRP